MEGGRDEREEIVAARLAVNVGEGGLGRWEEDERDNVDAEDEERERARVEGERGITRAGECLTGVLGSVCVDGG